MICRHPDGVALLDGFLTKWGATRRARIWKKKLARTRTQYPV